MDAGIIAALKIRYKRYHMESALDKIDINARDVYKGDVLTAIKWFKKAWNELPATVIQN